MMNQFFQNVMLEFTLKGKELVLAYERRTEKCTWSVFDIGGVEVCSGMLADHGPHSIPLDALSPDLYQLCVIDGSELMKTKFRLA